MKSWFLSAALCLCSCLAHNDVCEGDEAETVGFTKAELDLRASVLRKGEAPMGNLVADAFHSALSPRGADIALVNAGAIRGENSACGPSTIASGPISSRDITRALPFGYTVELVQLTGFQLRRALEHSVAHLGDPGPVGEAERFLQVSHLAFTVDCNAPAQEGTQVGQRIGNITIMHDDGTSFVIDTQDEIEATYQVATNSFLAAGSDGFVWLSTSVPGGTVQTDTEVLSDFIKQAPGQTVHPGIEDRIALTPSCLR